VITTRGEPSDLESWAGPFSEVRPSVDAGHLSGRPVLVLHGADDDVVPVDDARMIAQAVGQSAELRILAGAGHRLNSDPRAIALLLGWLERQRT
jgi:putative redox protein